jgi:heat-inducible transcriptional repressor
MEIDVLSARKQAILKSIVEQYVTHAVPVPSQQVVKEHELAVSSATVRNEMAYLEHEGYIIRPHTSAGSVPSDKGYRYYVETLDDMAMPASERVLIDHLFHQVEEEVENWLGLAVTLLAQMTQNVAIVSMPKAYGSRFKHVELVSLQDYLVLVVFVLYGAKVKQQLITFEERIDQTQLSAMANKLNTIYFGLNYEKISLSNTELTQWEKSIRDCLLRMMYMEDESNAEEAYLEGWHFLLHQPEFEQTSRVLALMELAERRNLLRTILPQKMPTRGVKVVIGRENEAEAIRDYSIIIGHYGLAGEAVGTVGVVGPTRMEYGKNLSIVNYLVSVLNELISELYGRKLTQRDNTEAG